MMRCWTSTILQGCLVEQLTDISEDKLLTWHVLSLWWPPLMKATKPKHFMLSRTWALIPGSCCTLGGILRRLPHVVDAEGHGGCPWSFLYGFLLIGIAIFLNWYISGSDAFLLQAGLSVSPAHISQTTSQEGVLNFSTFKLQTMRGAKKFATWLGHSKDILVKFSFAWCITI